MRIGLATGGCADDSRNTVIFQSYSKGLGAAESVEGNTALYICREKERHFIVAYCFLTAREASCFSSRVIDHFIAAECTYINIPNKRLNYSGGSSHIPAEIQFQGMNMFSATGSGLRSPGISGSHHCIHRHSSGVSGDYQQFPRIRVNDQLQSKDNLDKALMGN